MCHGSQVLSVLFWSDCLSVSAVLTGNQISHRCVSFMNSILCLSCSLSDCSGNPCLIVCAVRLFPVPAYWIISRLFQSFDLWPVGFIIVFVHLRVFLDFQPTVVSMLPRAKLAIRDILQPALFTCYF